MMINAVLSNPHHPDYGVVTIPFPIPHDQYAHCMELLEALEVGHAVKADCKVEEINSFYTVLKRMEMLTVNAEELNYLAKRLDGFDAGEAAQFQTMAHKLELFELKDIISRIFQSNSVLPSNPAGIRIDSKRRRRLMEKRTAMGHKADDHEEQTQYQQSM